MRQKMPPKIAALDTLLMARPMLVALSLLTCRLQHAPLLALHDQLTSRNALSIP